MKDQKFKIKSIGFNILPTLVIILFVGCRATPKKDTGFLNDPKRMKPNALIPVHRVWKEPTTSIKYYNKIIVNPVFTKAQLKNSFLENMNLHTYFSSEKKNVKSYATYIQKGFITAIKKSKRFKLATEPGPKTMVLELSLVKIVPGKPVLGIISNLGNLTPIGLLLAPVKMTVNSTTETPMQSSVAIEGRIIDSETKNAIAMFADNRKQKTAFFNVRDFRPYGNPEQIADNWTAEFIKVLETTPLETKKAVKPAGVINAINF